MHRILPHILISSFLLLSGCAFQTDYSAYTPINKTTNYTPAVRAYALDLPQENITSSQILIETLSQFLQRHDDLSDTTMFVSPAGASSVSATSVRQALLLLGFKKTAITIAKSDPLLAHTTVTLQGYTILKPQPETWNFPATTADMPNSQFFTGSSVNANIGAMIANPKNSLERRELAPADAQYNINVIKAYREEPAGDDKNDEPKDEPSPDDEKPKGAL